MFLLQAQKLVLTAEATRLPPFLDRPPLSIVGDDFIGLKCPEAQVRLDHPLHCYRLNRRNLLLESLACDARVSCPFKRDIVSYGSATVPTTIILVAMKKVQEQGLRSYLALTQRTAPPQRSLPKAQRLASMIASKCSIVYGPCGDRPRRRGEPSATIARLPARTNHGTSLGK